MKNRKAQVPEGIFILVAISLCVYAGYSVYVFEKNTAEKISPPEHLLKMYDDESNFRIYGEQALMVLGHHSTANFILNFQNNSKCSRMSDGTLILADSCVPSNVEIKNGIIDEMEKEFMSLFPGNLKHKFSYENDKVNLIFDEIYLNVSDKDYEASYHYSKNFSTVYPLNEDIQGLYSRASSKKNECVHLGENNPSFDVMGCSKGVRFIQWNSECTTDNAYLICDLKTHDNFLYGNSFKPIEFRFALRILQLAPLK